MEKKNNKKYISPNVTVIEINSDEIITTSGGFRSCRSSDSHIIHRPATG